MLDLDRLDLDEIASCASDSLSEGAFEPRGDYSGRGMYGETCLGFDGPRGAGVTLGAAIMYTLGVLGDDPDTALEMAAAGTTDSMGLGTIYYFPGWTVEGSAS